MADEQPPAYEGQSMALHVTDTRTTVSPEPEGPPTDDPVIPGKSKPITSHVDSPAQWMDETVIGPQVSFASYWARSRAIHVFGSPRSRTPPPTVPSCRCCAETGGGTSENCDPITGGTFAVFDDFEGRTTGPNSWGTAHPGSFVWTTSAGTGSSASVSGGAGHLVAAASGGFASAALINIHLKGKLVISFDFTILSPGDSDNPTGGILIEVGGDFMPNLTFHLTAYDVNTDFGPYTQIALLETAHGFYDFGTGPPYPYVGPHSEFGAAIAGSGTCYIVADELGATVLVGGNVFGRINWSNDNATDVSFVTPFDVANVTFSVFSGASVDIDNIRIKDSATYGQVCTPGTGHAAGDCNDTGSTCSCSTVEVFGRTLASGWGKSEIDSLPFRTNPYGAFSVTPGSGNVLGVGNVSLFLTPGAASIPFEILEEFTIPAGADKYILSVGIEGTSGQYAYCDFSRTSSTLEVEFYASNPGGTDGDNVHSGQLSGYAGVPIKIRLRVDATVSAKWWLASDPEPGSWSDQIVSGVSPTAPLRWVNYTNDPLTVQRLEFTAGYTCGGTVSGSGGTSLHYFVDNTALNHSGDATYSIAQLVVGQLSYDGVFSAPDFQFHTFGRTSSGGPGWSRDFAGHDGSGNGGRSFVSVGGTTALRFKVDFDPNEGTPTALGPLGVGVFAYGNPIVPGTSGSPFTGFDNLVDSIKPIAVIEAGQWYPLNGQTVLISPHPLTAANVWDENDYDTDQDIYWANPQNGFADGSYYPWGASFGHTQDGDPFSRTGYEPFLITVESAVGDTVYTACTPGCAECVDPVTGLDIPDFTPGFMPTFRKQIGDPTTNLDSFICTLEAGAMVLDWQTRGAVSVWGGELIPYCGKTEAQILGTGTSLSNIRQAWLHWDQYLDIRSGGTWNDLMAALAEGRAVILQGDYGVFSNAIKCQDSFDGGHAISVYPYQVSDRLLCGDPLCSTFYGIPIAALQDYAEALGASVFGVTSPQKILFAVSRPWTP